MRHPLGWRQKLCKRKEASLLQCRCLLDSLESPILQFYSLWYLRQIPQKVTCSPHGRLSFLSWLPSASIQSRRLHFHAPSSIGQLREKAHGTIFWYCHGIYSAIENPTIDELLSAGLDRATLSRDEIGPSSGQHQILGVNDSRTVLHVQTVPVASMSLLKSKDKRSCRPPWHLHYEWLFRRPFWHFRSPVAQTECFLWIGENSGRIFCRGWDSGLL